MRAFVDGITESKDTSSWSRGSNKSRELRRQVCIESLYSAKHLKYTSEFFAGFEAVAYAICGSKAVVNMIGHLGPGCGYQLLKKMM